MTDLEPVMGNNGPFLISINKQMNCMTIFAQDGANGFIIPVKTILPLPDRILPLEPSKPRPSTVGVT